MTDYPTRAEIDAAADVIERLQVAIDRGAPTWGVTWSGLETAREILTHLGELPGLPDPDPEPEPKPTAAEVLHAAWKKAQQDSANESILWAAYCYAEDHPEWFANWYEYDSPESAVSRAGVNAHSEGDTVASNVLWGVSNLAAKHPDLFGGASC